MPFGCDGKWGLRLSFQDPRVLDAMLPYQVNYYGNPHSRTHAYGWESESAMERARKVHVTFSLTFLFIILLEIAGDSHVSLFYHL